MRKPVFIARQGRRPSGFLGYIVAVIMAKETAPENSLTLDLLDLRPGDNVLEVGCGHGTTLCVAASTYPDVQFTGIDLSDVSLRVARHRNKKLIASGVVHLDQGNSASLPYSIARFDTVFSVHTLYFWRQPEVHLNEILRVLTPGGRFILGFRSGDDTEFSAKFPRSIYHMRPKVEIKSLVEECGFQNVECHIKAVKGHPMFWITAHKPKT